jgi:hypothetical protein
VHPELSRILRNYLCFVPVVHQEFFLISIIYLFSFYFILPVAHRAVQNSFHDSSINLPITTLSTPMDTLTMGLYSFSDLGKSRFE